MGAPVRPISLDDALAAMRQRGGKVPGVAAESTAAVPKPAHTMDDALAALREPPGGAAGAAIEGVANGAMLGGGAYAGGLLDTLLQGSSYRGHFHDNLNKNIATERQNVQSYQTAHPIATAAGEVAGGAIPAVLAEPLSIGSAAAKYGTLARVGGSVADGALAGTASGAISANPGQIASGARRGAVVGGLLGAAVPAVAGAASGIRNTARTLTGTGVDDRAIAKLAEIAAQAKMAPSDIARAGADAQATGTPALLGDLLGTPGRRAVQWTVGQPSGEGASLLAKLEDRMGGQYDRVLGRVQDAVGQPFQNMPQTSDALLNQRRQAAQPLYDAAYAKGPVMTPTLEKALQDPDFAKAIEKGRSLAAKRSITNPGPAADAGPGADVMAHVRAVYGNDPTMLAFVAKQVGANPDVAASAAPGIPIEVLDYAKRYLDNGIRRGFDAQSSFDHTTATATNGLLGKVLDEVDAQVPEYARARAQYHSDSRMLDALDLGRQALTMHPDELAAAASSLSDPEKEMMRAGFMDAFKQKAGSVADRNDLSKRILADPNAHARFRAVMPDAMSALEKLRDQETGLAQTLNFAKGGSNTADKLMFAQAMQDGIRPADLAVLPFSPHRTMIRLASRFGQGIQSKANARLADELAPMLGSEPGTPQFQTALDRLMSYGDPTVAKSDAAGRQSLIARALSLRAGESQP